MPPCRNERNERSLRAPPAAQGEVVIKGEARQGLISDDDTSNKLKASARHWNGHSCCVLTCSPPPPLAADCPSLPAIRGKPCGRPAQVGLVFQSGALFDSLTVGENVGFLLREHSDLPEARIRELVAESLGKVRQRGGQAPAAGQGSPSPAASSGPCTAAVEGLCPLPAQPTRRWPTGGMQ